MKGINNEGLKQLAELLEAEVDFRGLTTDPLDFVAMDLMPMAQALGISMLEMLHLYASEVEVQDPLHLALCLGLKKVDGITLESIPGIMVRYDRAPMVGLEAIEQLRDSGMLDMETWRGTYDVGVKEKVLKFKKVWHL